MRVLFVISGLGLGGAERQVVLLSKEMVARGHGVSIYTLNRETARLDELEGAGVEVLVDQKRKKLDLGVISRLRRHIRRWRPDLVHGFLYDGDIYARLAGFGGGIPVLNSERSDNYKLSVLQRLGYRVTSMLCDGVVANSHAGAEFAVRLHRASVDRAHVVWNGIDLAEVDARLARSPRPAEGIFPGPGLKRICMVGSIKPAKDYPLALRVVRCLADMDPSWRLICVGDELAGATTEYKGQVLADRDRLQLEPFVKFVGHRRDVPEIISSCDVLLVTSLYEGFPNVVLEAMTCGTPVVSTDYSDVRRILPFPEQVVGSRIDMEIAEAVVQCFARSAELKAAQRDWVNCNGTTRASASSLLAVYERYVRVPSMSSST